LVSTYFTAHSGRHRFQSAEAVHQIDDGHAAGYTLVFSLTIASSIHSLVDFYSGVADRTAVIGEFVQPEKLDDAVRLIVRGVEKL
jgi:hypothetical protein